MHSLAHVTRRDRGRVGLPWLLGTLVLVGALVAAVAFGWTTGRLNPLVCGGACGPEAVATPAGLTLDTVPERTAPDPVGLGAYAMDSHNIQRYRAADGTVRNEGDVQVRVPKPYGISYRALCPQRAQCDNLLVPVCASASHIAYGSIRMEPVFMVLGQSAAIAAGMAIAKDVAVQDLDYAELQKQLVKAGQVLGR